MFLLNFRLLLLLTLFYISFCRRYNKDGEQPLKCKTFGDLIQCRKLFLTDIPPIGQNYSSVELQQNYIRLITDKALTGSIEMLNLNDNRISLIETMAFKELPHLKELFLDKNRIEFILPEMFSFSKMLEKLSLKQNSIKVISKDMHFPGTLNHIQMEDNPIICSIEFLDSLKLTSEKSSVQTGCVLLREMTKNVQKFYCNSNMESKLNCYSQRSRIPLIDIHETHNKLASKSKLIRNKREISFFAKPIAFDCESYNSGNAWYHNNKPMDNGKVLSNGTLVIKDPSEETQGSYICGRMNDLGTMEVEAKYELFEPKIVNASTSERRAQGESVTFYCEAEGSPTPNILWQKGTQLLQESENIRFENDDQHLTIFNLQSSDEGDIACIAENSIGYDSVLMHLDVYNSRTRPEVLIEPTDVEAISGSTVEMPCYSQSYSQLKWKKDGRTIINTNKHYVSSTGSLQISNVHETDAGRYECTIANEYGRTTVSAILTVTKHDEYAVGDKYLRPALIAATKEVDSAIEESLRQLFDNKNSSTRGSSDLFKLFRFPRGQARQLARAAEIYEKTLENVRRMVNKDKKIPQVSEDFQYKDLLSDDYVQLLTQLSDCLAHRITPNCTDICYHSKYRTIDGTCNNLKNPLWGSSLTSFQRLLPAEYENSLNLPIGWSKEKKYNGYVMPSARLVSTSIISTENITSDEKITHLVMGWGQFLDHDLDHAIPAVTSESWDGVDCKKTCDFRAPCFPIEVPKNDSRVTDRRCIDFFRSSATCGSGMSSVFFGSLQPREQINQPSSYIDASQVYGFTYQFSQDLRNLTEPDRGLLKEGIYFPYTKPLLPFAAPTDGMDCRRNLVESTVNCFTAGDIRVNEQVGLISMHTIFFREHNRIARKFAIINPHWDGEKIYQESRKIVGALMQHITYDHWLQFVIGPDGMMKLGNESHYNSDMNPTVLNEFATAAFRFGHTLINPILHRYDSNLKPIMQGHLPLHKAFFAPWRIVYEGGIDPLMRGLFVTPAKLKLTDQTMNSELTEKLFMTAHAVALDLAAINIQRGRDHGIPSYNKYRATCGLKVAKSFSDLEAEIPNRDILNKLESMYGHPDNIDLFVGGILETPHNGARVGPLFSCLIIDQFRRLRDGDRFWYENESVFTPAQLQEIKKITISKVICQNADNITQIAENAFLLPQLQGGFKNCDELPELNFEHWTDCSDCSRSAHNLDLRWIDSHR